MALQRYINKKYVLEKTENYDAYLRALKVKLFYRKMACVDKPVVHLWEKDGKYILESSSWFQSHVTIFRPGIPFEDTRLDGQPCRSVVDMEDNKLTHVQSAGSYQSILTWEFSDKTINTTITHGDIVSKMTYQRLYDK